MLERYILRRVGDARKQGGKGVAEALRVTPHKVASDGRDILPGPCRRDRRVLRHKAPKESVLDLLIREAQNIFSKLGLVIRNRKISCLVEQWNRIRIVGPVVGEILPCRGEGPVREGSYIKTDFAEYPHEECRCACLEPVIVHFSFLKRTKKAERVVNTLAALRKMVPVIILFQESATLLFTYTEFFRQK